MQNTFTPLQPTVQTDGTGPDTAAGGYRGPAVCKLVGITYRQLDYWARTKLVTPSVQEATGSGTQRLYSFDDIVRLRVIKRLIDAGVSLQKVRQALDEVQMRGQSLADLTLVSDGSSVYAIDDDQQMIDLLQRGQGVFAIALRPVVDELRGEVRSFPQVIGLPERPSADSTPAQTPAVAPPTHQVAN